VNTRGVNVSLDLCNDILYPGSVDANNGYRYATLASLLEAAAAVAAAEP